MIAMSFIHDSNINCTICLYSDGPCLNITVNDSGFYIVFPAVIKHFGKVGYLDAGLSATAETLTEYMVRSIFKIVYFLSGQFVTFNNRSYSTDEAA